MEIYKKVREFAGLNPYKMHKKMGKKSLQSYLHAERRTKSISAEEIKRLRDLYLDSGGTIGAFYALFNATIERKP